MASATKNGIWWEISIPGRGEKVRTRRVGEVEELARRHVPGGTGTASEIEVEYRFPPGLGGIAEEWEAAGLAADEAAAARAEAARLRRAVVGDLRAAGYTIEEIGKALGLSKQRISQIARSRAPAPRDGSEANAAGRVGRSAGAAPPGGTDGGPGRRGVREVVVAAPNCRGHRG